MMDPAALAAAYTEMRTKVRSAFSGVRERLNKAAGPGTATNRLLGTSGTVTTLGSLYLDLPCYDRSQVDGLNVPTAEMRKLCNRLANMSIDQRADIACIGRERADLVVAGCAILEEICDIWPSPRLDVADRGIREGVLRQLMASHTREPR
jgi:exopolyphosphatase/guanosine-5'-triphosphate,3'-diphosphate pyrophosphatase